MRFILAPLLLLVLTSCGSTTPVESFAPLDYSYLHPLVLKVASLNVVDDYVPGAAEVQLNANNPAPPAPVLMTMLKQRLQPSGQPGSGTVTVQVVSITQGPGTINGMMTVDVQLSSPDGRATGFAEASVSASIGAPGSDADQNETQAALYMMTRKLMDAMNVQLPYQIMHNMPSWVVVPGVASGPTGQASVPGAIEAAPLSPPPVPSAGLQTPPAYLPGAGPAALVAPAPAP